ncbi:MAG: prepilin-type N-terminal cleavage/methylation domain-containing protein [Proteobacteria bacterium]|nr:prepilin-type N-terminal cleavage/methylation domain-containing protein [Pseudomonadota bacterium]
MKVIVQRNKKGFTLIETLIAVSILTIAMLAMLNTIVISFQYGLRNSIRNEAVKMAEKKMNELRNTTFSSLVSSTSTETRTFRNLTVTYTQQWTVSTLSTTSVAIDVKVSWFYPPDSGKQYDHSTASIVSQDT